MTGFQYDGAQYDGAQWDSDPISGQVWDVDGQRLTVVGVTLTPTTLELVVRARKQAERDKLDTLDDNAGALDTRTRADGTHDGLDTAGGSNTITVTPPTTLRPPRAIRDWLVDDVTRDRTSADTQAIEGTVQLVAQGTRAAVTGYDDGTAASDEWTFAFAPGGTLITSRVSTISQEATTSVILFLDRWQAEVFETVAAAVGGAVTEFVPDGQTFTRDTTPNDRQTVTITPPSSASDPAISTGDYVIETWESVGADAGRKRIEMEISTRFDPN